MNASRARALALLFRNRAFTPARLLGTGIVILAVALFVGYQSWDLDHGLPAEDALRTARGAIDSVNRRHGLEFRLVGQPEVFRFPGSTRPSQETAEALEQAAEKRTEHVELLYTPKPARTFTGEVHRLVYEIRVDGRTVHSYAETASAWRNTRRLGRVMAQIAAGLGIAFVLLAFRKARATKSWTAQDEPR